LDKYATQKTFETAFPNIVGNENTKSTIQIKVQQHKHNFILATGPSICSNITNGLRDQRILPTGGGMKGFTFGSDLPCPTLHKPASGIVKISRETRTSPHSYNLGPLDDVFSQGIHTLSFNLGSSVNMLPFLRDSSILTDLSVLKISLAQSP